jgi:hypothetical protein
MRLLEVGLVPHLQRLFDSILMRTAEYGQDVVCRQSAQDEECERELELHTEEEQEEQVQHAFVIALKESDWDVGDALRNSTYPTDMPTEIISLKDFINKHVPAVHSIKWDRVSIFGTLNFFNAVDMDDWSDDFRDDDLSSFLRLIDIMLVYSDGCVLLLSEREGEKVLRKWIVDGIDATGTGSSPPILCHMSYISSQTEGPCRLSLPFGYSKPGSLEHNELAALQLFSGETMFEPEARRAAVRQLLPPYDAAVAIKHLLEARGTSRHWKSSHLHEEADRMAAEAKMRR